MSYSKAEQSLIVSVAEHSYSYVTEPRPYAAYYFSQYVASEFLKLYFYQSQDKDLFDFYLLILQASLEHLNLESLRNGIQLTRTHQQMVFLEKEHHKLKFFSTRPTPAVKDVPIELSDFAELEIYQTKLQNYIDQLLDLMAKKLKVPKKQIQNKSQHLFDIYQKLRAQADRVYEVILEGRENHKDLMLSWVTENLSTYFSTPEQGFLARNGFYLLAGLLILFAATSLTLPYWGVIIPSLNVQILSFSFFALGAFCAFINGLQSFYAVDACEQKYGQLQNI